MTLNVDAVKELCAQLTHDLFAITKFLKLGGSLPICVCTVIGAVRHAAPIKIRYVQFAF